MDDHAEKSCWGITAKAIVGFGIAVIFAYVLGVA